MFLVLQGDPALLQTDLFLGEAGLLGGNSGGLDAQGVTLVFAGRRCPANRFRTQDLGDGCRKLERPNIQEVAVLEKLHAHFLPVDHDLAVAGQVAQHVALGRVRNGTVQRLDAVDVQPHFAAGSLAYQSQGIDQRSAHAFHPAGVDNQLPTMGRFGSLVARGREVGADVHRAVLSGQSRGLSFFIVFAGKEVEAECSVF